MVLREKKINNKSDNVQLQVSFGVSDIKALFKVYAEMCNSIKDLPMTEQDVRYWLEHDGRAFLSWPNKWKEQLTAWAFSLAVRTKLLIATATNENKYFLADCLFAKRGRPHKED